MAIPVVRQVIRAFRGLQEALNTVSLSDTFSSSGSYNVWMDEFARVRKILGYDNQNTAVTTNTGGSATKCVGLAQYRNTSGVTVSRSLVGVFDDAANEWEIWTSTDDGANWTFRADIGASAVGRLPAFAQFGTVLYICTTVGTPRTWNNTAIGTAGGTQSPTPTTVSGGAGNLSGTFRYKLVSVEADGSRHPGSAVSTPLQLEDEDVNVSWTADADTDVVGYELYRTTGTGLIFRMVAYIDARLTVAYTDNMTDEDQRTGRVLQEHGDAPPAAHFCAPHQQRMWWGRTDTYPLRAWYSDPNDADSVWVDYNYVDFLDEVSIGDNLTGLIGGFLGMLVGFTERSIWTVSGSGEPVGGFEDWSVSRSGASVGAVSHASVVALPAGALYTDQFGEQQRLSAPVLAYFTPYGDIRVFDGGGDEIVSHAVKTTLDGFNYGQRGKVFAQHDPVRKHVTWYFANGSDLYNSKGVTWNYRYGIWYAVTPASFACGATVETSAEEALLLLGEAQTAVGGLVYKNWYGNTFNGTDITAQYITKPLFGVDQQTGEPLFHVTKRWRDLDVLLVEASAADLMVEWLAGYAEDDASADGVASINSTGPIVQVDGEDVFSSDGELLYTSQLSVQIRSTMQKSSGDYPVSEEVRIRVKDTSDASPWAVEAIAVGYQPLPGVRAINR